MNLIVNQINFGLVKDFLFSYLNKLADQYNNIYHHYINKNSINGGYSTLTEKLETNSKAPKFKVNDGV